MGEMMNDRFKFRFCLFGEMKDVVSIDFENECVTYNEPYYDDPVLITQRIKDGSLIQSTGLKDKNGKLIYEGDIIKTCNGYIHVIAWKEERTGWGFNDHSADRMLLEDDGKHYEIIGNIHEKLELSEGIHNEI